MTDILILLLGAVFVNNVVLAQYLGASPLFSASSQQETAAGMAAATMLVLTLSALFNHLAWHWLLVPLDLQFLRTFVFIMIITAVASSVGMAVQGRHPLPYKRFAVLVPLLITNCAVLGVTLLNTMATTTLLQSVLLGFAAAAGFSLVLLLFAAMRERLAAADVPEPFRGAALAMIAVGLMALSFTGFAGLV